MGGYEQVERASEALRRAAGSLKTQVAASQLARSPASGKGAEDHHLALAESRRLVEELQGDKDDLLELLGCIVAALPEASRFVAPLGLPSLAAAGDTSRPARESAAET